jgi:NitT/TauT family transport system ATP-binding protein
VRNDPQAPERFGATIASDFEAKCRIVRESRRFEAARTKARTLALVSNNPMPMVASAAPALVKD